MHDIGAPSGRLIKDQLGKEICVRAKLGRNIERSRGNFEPLVAHFTPFALMARADRRGIGKAKPRQHATAPFDAEALHHLVDVGWAIALVG